MKILIDIGHPAHVHYFKNFIFKMILSGNQVKLIAATEEERKGLSVFNYKLVGIIESEDNMFASLIDQDGEVLTLSLFEELTPCVRLIALDSNEIVFEREEDSLVVINFKNQIVERNK